LMVMKASELVSHSGLVLLIGSLEGHFYCRGCSKWILPVNQLHKSQDVLHWDLA